MTRPPSQSDRAYETVRERLRKREYLPGQLLSESVIASELGMSRTPIREAIQRLAQDGFLYVLPKRGIVVSSPSLEDVEEIYAVREVLEGLAASLCTGRATKDGIARLERILQSAEQAVADGGGLEVLTSLDHDFHAEIARQTHNRRLQGLVGNMRDADLLQQYGWRDIAQLRERYRHSLNEHRRVLDAIVRGDARAAEFEMREHCRLSARFLATCVFTAPFEIDESAQDDQGHAFDVATATGVRSAPPR